MKRIIVTGDLLDEVYNTHNIIVFSNTTVIMEVNTQMEVTLYNASFMCISYPSLRLVVSTVMPLGIVVTFSV